MPRINEFAKDLYLVKESYQNKAFEGNQVNIMLNNTEKMKDYVPNEYMDFVEAFEALNEVKKNCFVYEAGKNWYSSIRNFELKWIVLKVKYNLSITNKVHIIFSHIQEVIYKTGKGLGEGSEQSLEACHHKFDVIWQWYKVKDHQSPNHGEQLFKCVQHFNCFNI